jgi:lysozyme
MSDDMTSDAVYEWPAFLAARRTNEGGINLIKEYEGLRLATYLCAGGVLTIGYGHTRNARPGLKITKEQAESLLQEDLRSVERAVEKLVRVPLNDNQFASLVAFAFNVGVGNFERSTLLRLLNRGWYEQVPAQLMRWTKANGEMLGGLQRRRAAEARLWNRAVTVVEAGA